MNQTTETPLRRKLVNQNFWFIIMNTFFSRLRSNNLAKAFLALLCALMLAGNLHAEERAKLWLNLIDDWDAIDDRQIVIKANRDRKFLATTFTPCIGLRTADTIAFLTSVGSQIDVHSSIVLPNGNKCHFKTFVELPKSSDVSLKDGEVEVTVEE